MLTVTRIKKTSKIVHPIGANGSKYTWCLFPYEDEYRSDRTKRGAIQSVKNENLVRDREDLF